MSICTFNGSPPLNGDIAGIGVRLSTYIQAFLAVVVITVSPSVGDIHSQAFPYVIMNIAVMASALVLGFSSKSQITLQDATIAWFFTIIPLIVLHLAGMKLRHRNKLSNAINTSDWDLIGTLVAMSIMYTLSAGFTLAVFRHPDKFGRNPECNGAARLFFFGTHKVAHGWFLGMAIFYGILLAIVFLPMIIKSILLVWMLSQMRKPSNDEERAEAERQRKHIEKLVEETQPETDFKADYTWGVIVSILLVIWITFTELTVAKNHFAPSDGSPWQFGQIFPLFLLAIPLFITSRAVANFVRDGPKRKAEIIENKKSGQRAGLLETLDKIIGDPEQTGPVEEK
ncbi:hypothetical protein CPB83DRAFT_855975 [Crepidotus variabilis]|uniref:Uncharacterized protein n=1 Tax=Crepidotus variabilis TaxID=179855 RepID=A0A9P6EF04_9AGAR|nr:hypothetical protein CPB83DRAFT_855975 [Crepidotus variabilis]